MRIFFQTIISGVMVGSVYSVVALGVVIIYKATSVFNFAHGEILMLGSLLTWTFLVSLGLPVWITFVAVVAFAVLLGMAVEQLVMRPMVGQPILSMIIVTLALSALLSGIGNLFYGEHDYYVLPRVMSIEPIRFSGMVLSRQHLTAFFISIIALGIFTLFFNHTKWGLEMQAVANDHQAARATGISTKLVFRLSWVISAIVAVIAGVILSTISGANLELPAVVITAFPVIILGGLESIHGVMLAGPIVGVLQYLAAKYLDPLVGGGAMDVAPFVILILVLLVRPYGLFGIKRIERI